MASTARAGDKPTATIVKIAAAQARIARKRHPAGELYPCRPVVRQGRSGAPSVSGPRPVRTLVKFTSISRPPCLSKKADAISPDCSKADQKEQESQSIARAKEGPGPRVSTILPICALLPRAWASAAYASAKVLSISGRTLPGGSTCSPTEPAIAALSATERARSVAPVWVGLACDNRRIGRYLWP